MSGIEPKQLKVRSHHIEISVLDYGNEGAPPMLLVHGMRDLAWSLDTVAQHFRDRFRVVAMDQRGDSDHVGYYAMSHFVIDVRQVVLGLGLERPVLLGHSFGGEVVAQFAGLFPEVPAACVLLEGLGPPPWEGEGSREAGLFWARSAIEALDGLELRPRGVADLDAATERVRRNHPGLDAARASFLAERGTRPAGGEEGEAGGLVWKWDPFLRTSWGSFNFQQVEECWKRIECPTLAVNGGASGEFWRRDMGGAKRGGEAESYLPADELQRRLDCFSDIECTEVPGAGHMIHFDAPDAVNRAIDDFVRARGLGRE
jgi:pimeloyl-ACP methyl ester carboxylesterase